MIEVTSSIVVYCSMFRPCVFMHKVTVHPSTCKKVERGSDAVLNLLEAS